MNIGAFIAFLICSIIVVIFGIYIANHVENNNSLDKKYNHKYTDDENSES